MKKLYTILCFIFSISAFSQTGTTFWFAPPNITNDHRPAEQNEVYLNITCLSQDASVHI